MTAPLYLPAWLARLAQPVAMVPSSEDLPIDGSSRLVADWPGMLARRIPGDRWLGVCPMAFTTGLVMGWVGDTVSVLDRWCYLDPGTAVAALHAWDGRGDPPAGWVRQVSTGRRRPMHDQDPLDEVQYR